jgi:outer membrane lipoprotein SlyB
MTSACVNRSSLPAVVRVWEFSDRADAGVGGQRRVAFQSCATGDGIFNAVCADFQVIGELLNDTLARPSLNGRTPRTKYRRLFDQLVTQHGLFLAYLLAKENRVMNKSLFVIAAFVLGLPAMAVAPVQAQSRHHQQHRQVCENVRVKHNGSKDDHRLIGTGVGAVAGGLLGHQVGGGKGKTLATIGGAVAGGYVGNRVQKNAQDKKTYYTTERKCHDVND